MFVDINLEIIALKNHVPMFLLILMIETAKHIYQVVILQTQKYVVHIYHEHVNLMQLQEQMQPKHPLAKSFKMLKERFVDIKLDPIVLQNHDVFTKTNDAACKAYLPTCYLSAASTCTATKTGRCESYATSGTNATAKAAICNSQLDSDGKICGYISREAPNPKCSAKSCDDVFPKNNDEACKAYLPTCYLSAVGKCSAVGSSACDSYKPTGDDY